MVDISWHLFELNKKLQEPNQLLNVMFVKVKSFETKLELWKVQLQNHDTTNFPILQDQKPCIAVEYACERAKISEAFIERFQDIKCKKTE